MNEPVSGEPRITVIVTFYNQERWVEQALDSVMGQTEQNFQLLITDDGSIDGTRDRIEAWQAAHGKVGVVVGGRANRGLPSVLNEARPLIRGRYVVILNGDDWLEPNRFDDQALALDDLPNKVGLVYSDLRVVDESGAPTGDTFPPANMPRPEGNVFLDVIARTMIGMPCVMFRRSILDVIGPWDETLASDDFDFLLRMAGNGFEFSYLPKIVLNYRNYGGSLTGSRNARLADDRIAALLKWSGRDAVTDRAILNRVQELALALHSLRYDSPTTRRRLRYVLRRAPSRRVVRAVIESHLGIRAGRLSPRYWIRTLRRRRNLDDCRKE